MFDQTRPDQSNSISNAYSHPLILALVTYGQIHFVTAGKSGALIILPPISLKKYSDVSEIVLSGLDLARMWHELNGTVDPGCCGFDCFHYGELTI